MSWIATSVLAGVGAGKGLLDAQNQRQQKKAELMANATQIQYSPWTGMKADVQGMGELQSGASAALGGALQGGLSGHMMASQFKRPKVDGPEAPNGGLGSTDYARQLGQQVDQFQASMSPAFQPAPQFAQLQKPTFFNSRG